MLEPLTMGGFSMTRALRVTGMFALLCGCAKDDDDGGDSTSTSSTTGTAWLVGDDAQMFRVSRAGEVSIYDITADGDFLAIACHGAATAWVAGADGLLMVTRDAGATWHDVDVGTTADLTAVAVAEHGGVVWVVGESGTILAGHDDGASWSPWPGPPLDWSGVATDHAGDSAVVVARDGTIARIDEALAIVHVEDGAVLRGIARDGVGRVAVAVGDVGTMLISRDGGGSFVPVGLPTTRDLHAVRVLDGGREIVAVGEAGVVVRIDESGATAEEQLDAALSLRALHLRATGLGQAVGDAGVVLSTHDTGLTWSPIAIDTDATLRGVDDFHVGPHP
jgi:photosystem II stability/assembly factor-like uncharacterized protein